MPTEESLPDVHWFLNCAASCSKNSEETTTATYEMSLGKCVPNSTILLTPPSTPESVVQVIDYRTVQVKPPLSYAQLISLCMEAAGFQKVLLSDIYDFIRANFMYYRVSDCSWKNSIRHNLSLNKQFVKLPRDSGDKGKGSYWVLASKITSEHAELASKRANDSQLRAPKVNPAVVNYIGTLMTKSKDQRKRSLEGEATSCFSKRQCTSCPGSEQNGLTTEGPSPNSPASDISQFSTQKTAESTPNGLSRPLPQIVLSLADVDYDVSMTEIETAMAALPQQDPNNLHVDMNGIGDEMWTDSSDKDAMDSLFTFPETYNILNEIDADFAGQSEHPWTDTNMNLPDDFYELYGSAQNASRT